MSEHARSALTTILLHSGEARPGFMMVLTSSRPQVHVQVIDAGVRHFLRELRRERFPLTPITSVRSLATRAVSFTQV